jgi:hypothetical protein
VKEFLSQAAAPFTAHNVDEDDRAYDELIARGFRTVPITVFGDHIVKGYDVPALTEALSRWRARS